MSAEQANRRIWEQDVLKRLDKIIALLTPPHYTVTIDGTPGLSEKDLREYRERLRKRLDQKAARKRLVRGSRKNTEASS